MFVRANVQENGDSKGYLIDVRSSLPKIAGRPTVEDLMSLGHLDPGRRNPFLVCFPDGRNTIGGRPIRRWLEEEE